MNDESIYFKTADGEAAVRERTRLVQRNLRTVLILVDGLADVAMLKAKTGDAAMVESALRELEGMGLIETREAGVEPELGVSPPLTFDAEESIAATDAVPLSSFDGSMPTVATAGIDKKGPEAKSGWWATLRRRRREAREEALYDKAYGEVSPVPPEDIGPASPITAKPAPTPPRRRKRKLGRLLLIAAVMAVALAVMRIVFYPYDDFRPRFEQHLTRVLGDTVTIGRLRVAFLPMPVVMLEKVSVGEAPYARIDMVRLVPELGSLFVEHRYRQVTAQGLNLSVSGIDRLSRWFAVALPEKAAIAGVGAIDIDRLWLGIGRESLGPLSGSMNIDSRRGINSFQLAGADKTRVDGRVKAAGVSLALHAGDWLSPFSPPLRFASLDIEGDLAPAGFNIRKLDGFAYDGEAHGTGELGWRDGVGLTLNLELQRIAADKMVSALNGPALLDGKLDSKLRLTAAADRLDRLGAALRADGSFKVVHGQLKHLDIVEALKPAGRQAAGVTRGGTTGFEEFAGSIAADNQAVRLTGLRLRSGLLNAAGNAVIARSDTPTLTGSIAVEITGGGGARGTVTISGTAATPELAVSR